MTDIEREGDWLVALPEKARLLFLATLAHELTIAGRGSYEAGTEDLLQPRWLRQVNEIQHRVAALLRDGLAGASNMDFKRSIARWVLLQEDAEFGDLMRYAWNLARQKLVPLPAGESGTERVPVKLSHSFSGLLRTFAYFMASGTQYTLEGIDYLSLYGNEPSAIEQVYAIFANVLEMDEDGEVLNARYAQKRATDYLRAYCDPGFVVDPPYEAWEMELY